MNPKFDVPAALVGRVVRTLLETEGAHKVTAYVTPHQTVKAKLVLFDGKLPRKGARRADIRLTIGDPNHAERKFIKLAQKASEPFPVKKMQVKFAVKV